MTGCFEDAPSDLDDSSSASDGSDTVGDGPTASSSTDPSASSVTDADADATATSMSGHADTTSATTPADAETASSGADGSTGTPVEEVVFDFVAEACTAQWLNDTGNELPCPGKSADMAGFMFTTDLESVSFEDGSTVTDGGLVMHPRWVASGSIQGTFAVDVEPGDVFRATIGCVQPASVCSVEFRLTDAKGQNYSPSPWMQTADGMGETIEVELPDATNELVLQIYAGEDSASDASLWIDPQLVRITWQ